MDDRTQIAAMLMPTVLSSLVAAGVTVKNESIAVAAISLADALLAELLRKKQEECDHKIVVRDPPNEYAVINFDPDAPCLKCGKKL